MAQSTQNSTTNYNEVMQKFQSDSKDIFKNNVEDYTVNDRNFMQQMGQMFGNAMSQRGINVVDPIYANFFHYNKMGMLGNADFPRVTRTHVFFTRPEMNFSIENLNAVPFFRWLYSKPIGKMIMCSLTDPEYFIGGPAALSNSDLKFSDMMEIINDYVAEYKFLNKTYNKKEGGIPSEEFVKWYANETDVEFKGLDETLMDALQDMASGNGQSAEELGDDPVEVARLQGLDFSSLYDDAALQNLTNNFSSAAAKFKKWMQDYSTYVNSHRENLEHATNFATGKTLREKLASLNLHQAKDILFETHQSAFDNFNFTSPFIPLLSNTCTQATGARDFTLQEHTYEEDEFSASLKVPTGMDELWGPGTLNTTFSDIAYGPVSLMLMVWVMYIHYVSRGIIMTTREHVTERILDYTCSIYVFVLGEDGRRIERWGKFTGCYPTSFPMSQQLEHNTNIDVDVLQKVSINWSYNRYEPMDPQVFTDFNFLSETEWLVKLKEPLWENIYDRESSIDKLNEYMLDLMKAENPDELRNLRSLNRSEALWTTIPFEKRGMSGKLPMALIEPAPKEYTVSEYPTFIQQSPKRRKDSEWYIDSMTNFWGGYPYINKGTELIWVLPQWTPAQDVYNDGLKNALDKASSTVKTNNSYEGENTGFSRNVAPRTSATKAANGFFIGNATLQTVPLTSSS